MKRILAIVSAFLLTNVVMGQSIQDVSFNATDSASSGLMNSSFVVQLSDSSSIDEIEVQLGSNDGLSDILSHSFGFDQTSGLTGGFSYSRLQNRIFLETGTINEYPTYFGRVRLKLSTGQYTVYFSFTSN